MNRPIMTGLHYDATNVGLSAIIDHVKANESWLGQYEDIDLTKPFGYTTTQTYPYGTAPNVYTVIHYDEYLGMPSALPGTYMTNWDPNFFATNNTQWPYPQMPVQSTNTRGMVTWTQTRILNVTPAKFITTVNIYDDKGRKIQVQQQNMTDGIDVVTTQFTWSGKPLIEVERHQIGANLQEHVIVTTTQYDDLFRVLSVKRRITSNVGGTIVSRPDQDILQNQYDNLGYVRNKKLSPAMNSGAGIENLAYDYNVRGWLLGINRNYLSSTGQSGTTKFGFEIGYDKLANSSGRNFTSQKFDGSITGMVWKTDGDDVKRKYDFTNDAVSRLLQAGYEQDDATNAWNNTTMNYDVRMSNDATIDAEQAYDYNGNIKKMTQYGWKIGGSPATPIDNLRYTYLSGGNKLKSVVDFNNYVQTTLGDFKTNASHPQSAAKTALNTSSLQSQFDAITDYAYDANANMQLDNNKDIATVTYNHLNLPQVITVTGKGTITYVYDAEGNKLKKTTQENNVTITNNGTSYPNVTITTTTSYIGKFVYESKAYSEPALASLQYTDKLQFCSHDEGRIRAVYSNITNPNLLTDLAYDYMLKDHLGNIRMVLTDENRQDPYPAATMENVTNINDLTDPANYVPYYTNVNYVAAPSVRETKPPGYGYDALTPSNTWVARVRAAVGSQKIGPGIVLKVMANDRLNIYVSSWYKKNGAGLNPDILPVNELILALSNNIGAVSGSHGGATISDLQNNSTMDLPANTFLPARPFVSTRPKAYLNWVMLDEQFKFVAANSSAEQVPDENEYYDNGNPATGNPIVKPHNVSIPALQKNGYLYIYVSNEEKDFSVYFDNLMVTHIRGPITEETHYYPYGLTMDGISSKALTFGGSEYKFRFNGYEQQNNEFADGSGLEWYDYKNRFYDNQVGRFFSQDKLAVQFPWWSPFQFGGNQVPNVIDRDGLEPTYPESIKDFMGRTEEQVKGVDAYFKYKPTENTFHMWNSYKFIAYYDKNTKAREQTNPSVPSGNQFTNGYCKFDCITSVVAGLRILYGDYTLKMAPAADGGTTFASEAKYLKDKGLTNGTYTFGFNSTTNANGASVPIGLNKDLGQELITSTKNEEGIHVFMGELGNGWHTFIILVDVYKEGDQIKYQFMTTDDENANKENGKRMTKDEFNANLGNMLLWFGTPVGTNNNPDEYGDPTYNDGTNINRGGSVIKLKRKI
jgi:RHS repeat-associated protein